VSANVGLVFLREKKQTMEPRSHEFISPTIMLGSVAHLRNRYSSTCKYWIEKGISILINDSTISGEEFLSRGFFNS
jgi:hypothetical protein